jgi:hypothetical protein
MTRWRDPRLPPSYRRLAPSLAARIPVNRLRWALEQMVDRQAARNARIAAKVDALVTAAEERTTRR